MRTKLEHLHTRPGDIKVLPEKRPLRRRSQWTVHVEVPGLRSHWEWNGFAADSIEARELALRDYYGPLFDDEGVRKRHPVRVVSVFQKGV